MNTSEGDSTPPGTADEDWGKALTAAVARQVRHYREQKGMSTQALADACTAAGYPVKRSVLVNLENSVRSRPRDSVSVQLVLMLARVLDVPPVLLLVPVGAEQDVEILPGAFAGPWQAYEWITGSGPLARRTAGSTRYGVDTSTDTMLFKENARPIELYGRAARALSDFRRAWPLDASGQMAAVRELVEVRAELRAEGLHVGELSGAVGKAVAAQEKEE
jgi:transcriptional regulator with XRE-family HTH domain